MSNRIYSPSRSFGRGRTVSDCGIHLPDAFAALRGRVKRWDFDRCDCRRSNGALDVCTVCGGGGGHLVGATRGQVEPCKVVLVVLGRDARWRRQACL